MPKAATLVPTSMSAALCGPESNAAAWPNQRSPRAINNGPNRSGRLLAIRRGRSAQSVCHGGVPEARQRRVTSPPGRDTPGGDPSSLPQAGAVTVFSCQCLPAYGSCGAACPGDQCPRTQSGQVRRPQYRATLGFLQARSNQPHRAIRMHQAGNCHQSFAGRRGPTKEKGPRLVASIPFRSADLTDIVVGQSTL